MCLLFYDLKNNNDKLFYRPRLPSNRETFGRLEDTLYGEILKLKFGVAKKYSCEQNTKRIYKLHKEYPIID